tara:strand:+ start:142 stop:357 length:216 start_codon:yes stop_codon:yes gene_type:complete
MLQALIKKLNYKSPVVELGRWGVLLDKNKQILIDQANIDNCGPCGNYSDVYIKQQFHNIENNIKLYSNKTK